MGEISQTKTSIECSLYSPIPAVAAPRAQTPSHTQFNRSSSRQSAKRLLLALLRLICNVLFVIVTFPAVHMSYQAMSPLFPTVKATAALVGSMQRSTWPRVDTKYLAVHLPLFPIHFILNCGFCCLLAPPVHLPFIMQLFWAWSQIF